MSEATLTLPGLQAGVWDIDPVHSDVSFTVRHMMVSKVRGTFGTFSGSITVGDDLTASAVQADVDLTSLDTRNEQRDNHIRSADFFDISNHPTLTFQSTGVRSNGGDWVVTGDLQLHGVTRSVDLDVEFNGAGPDAWGGYRAGFTAKTQINRKDFGIVTELPMDGGGVVVGDKIDVSLEIEAILRSGE